jgi:L-lactate dehydrogenase complex protein LldG
MGQTEERIENRSRERILARIRSALNSPAPASATGPAPGNIFAPVPDPLDRFQKECAGNSTECVLTPDMSASAQAVAGVLAALPPGEVFVQDDPKLRRIATPWKDARSIRWSSEGGPAEASQATITLAEALVAETGSVFVSAACGGRGASIVAPVHIVVASLEQLVPDLETAFARVRDGGATSENSFLCLITGSSRTGDIEKIQVLGAHGPRRVVVVLAVHAE